MGYHRAGFDEIVGVDNRPQKNYPFQFVQADMLEYLAEHGHEYDAIHASPPCQGYSIMNNLPWLKGRDYPHLILPAIEMLEGLGKPYVVENVMGARYGAVGLRKRGLEAHGLKAGWLCGGMFGLPFYRHRLFATNWFWMQPGHPKHRSKFRNARGSRPVDNVKWGHPNPVNTQWRVHHDGVRTFERADGTVGVRHAKGWRLAAEAMGIDWMIRKELTQAIPPAYTEYIGAALLKQLNAHLLAGLATEGG